MNKKEIKQYYKDNYKRIYDSVSYPQFRVWTARRTNGKFIRCRWKISSPEKLLKFLMQNVYDRLYVSISLWLNPTRFYGKKFSRSCNPIADSIFMGSDLFFDIDDNDLRVALADTRIIMEYMEKHEKNYILDKIQYSGGHGFHILYKDKIKITQAKHPLKRINTYQRERARIADKLLDLGCMTIDKNHKKIVMDQYRVYAATYSLKPDSNNIVSLLTKEDIDNLTADEIISKVKNHCPVRFDSRIAVDSKSMTSGVFTNLEQDISKRISPLFPHFRHFNNQGEERSGLSSYPITYDFVSNMVRGLKNRYIPILKYYGKAPLIRLKKAQQIYNLSSWYIFSSNNQTYAICLKVMDEDRLLKVMRYCRAKNIRTFMFRHHCWFRVTPKFILKEEICSKIKLKVVLFNKCSGHLSLPHKNLFKEFALASVSDKGCFIGKPEQLTGTAFITSKVEA